jgi:uncharacterized protein involved in response to NO
VPLAVLLAANACFHLESYLTGTSDVSRRFGLTAAILLIMIIGGRIIPSFTRNWLARENPGRLPAAFGRFDVAAIVISTAALAVWCGFPENSATAALLGAAAALQAARLARWAGDRTVGDPLVLILHLAYAFVPIGFCLVALAIAFPAAVPTAAGLHALGGGAIGAMTLSVMVRATLGHTGRPLNAGRGGLFVFAAILVAASIRILASFLDGVALIEIAGLAWGAAFLGFATIYGPALTRPRLGLA